MLGHMNHNTMIIFEKIRKSIDQNALLKINRKKVLEKFSLCRKEVKKGWLMISLKDPKTRKQGQKEAGM